MAVDKYKPLAEMRAHLKIVLERTTAVPFRWCTSRFKCVYCSTYFLIFSKLESHLNSVHSNMDFESVLKITIVNRNPICLDMSDACCKICGFTTNNFEVCIDHLTRIHEFDYKNKYRDIFIPFKMKDPNHCLICNYKCKNFGEHYRHYRDKHELVKKLLCDVCGISFRQQFRLDYHIRGVHDKSGFKCRDCGKTFELYHQWNYHYSSVHKNKSYKCCQCEKLFYSVAQKNLHERITHRINCFQCDECRKEFTVKDKLSSHLKRHFKLKDVCCTICGKGFYERKQLNSHLMSHSPERLWCCTVCGKICPTKRSLAFHERKHNVD